MSAASRAHLGLFIVCLGAIVSPLDASVNTAFPVIGQAFALSLRDIQWVVIPYVLAQSAFSLVAGDLGDRYGHRRVFALGLAGCAASLAAVSFSPDYPTMVALRVVQGAAVGVAVACAPALATLLYPPEFKARALARYAAAFSAAMAAGPWVGGLMLGAFGWPGVFAFRVPIALAALLLVPLLPAVALRAAADPAAPLPARAAFGGLGALRRAPFAGLQLSSVVLNAACFANLLLVPYLLVREAGASIATAGLMLSSYPGGTVLGNLLAGRLAPRLSNDRAMGVGLVLAAAGLLATAAVLAWVPLAAGAVPLALLAAGMAANGFGLGLFQVGYMDATTSWLPAGNRGTAGSLVNVTRLLGLVIGASGIGWLHAALGSDAAAFVLLGAAVALLAAVFGWRTRAGAEPNAVRP